MKLSVALCAAACAVLIAAGAGPAARAQAPDTTTAVPPAATAPPPAVDNAPPPVFTVPQTNPDTTTTVTPTPQPPPTQTQSRSRFRIGPSIGVYLPTDSKTRNRFGSAWLSLGLGFGPLDVVKSQGQLGFDLNIQYQKHDGNHVFLLPVGLGYRIALTKDAAARTIPYAGLTADAVFADIRSVPDNVHSGFRTGVGGSAILGVNVNGNTNFALRYQLISRIKSFDFSGLELSAGYRF